jgi:predicted aspartyl protease
MFPALCIKAQGFSLQASDHLDRRWRMGIFHARIGVANPDIGEFQWVDALVDTGANYSMFPESLLDQLLNLSPIDSATFRLADGRVQTYQLGQANFRIGDRERISPVVFGPEDRYLLGAVSLQSFGLIADTTNHQLVPAPELTL